MSFNGVPKAFTPKAPESEEFEVPSLSINAHAPALNAESSAIVQEQWKKFWKLRNTQNTASKAMVSPVIKPGYLTHHSWNTNALQSILKAGILSGELGFGEKETIAEDAETHYCADFFVSDAERSIPEYIEFTEVREKVGALSKPRGESFARPTLENDRIAFVIDPSQKGLDEMLKYSGSGVDKGELEKFPVQFPHEKSNHLAVLVGVPANFITMILVGGKIESDTEKIEEIKAALTEAGLSIPIMSTSGQQVG